MHPLISETSISNLSDRELAEKIDKANRHLAIVSGLGNPNAISQAGMILDSYMEEQQRRWRRTNENWDDSWIDIGRPEPTA